MTARVKISQELLKQIRQDLGRPHRFAAERVGFVRAKAAWAGNDLLLLCFDYMPVADEDYQRNPSVGAEIGPDAMRKALWGAHEATSSLLHIHSHGGTGIPRFSPEDTRSARLFVPGFFNTVSRLPHGIAVLSNDSAAGLLWKNASARPEPLCDFIQVGSSITKFGSAYE